MDFFGLGSSSKKSEGAAGSPTAARDRSPPAVSQQRQNPLSSLLNPFAATDTSKRDISPKGTKSKTKGSGSGSSPTAKRTKSSGSGAAGSGSSTTRKGSTARSSSKTGGGGGRSKSADRSSDDEERNKKGVGGVLSSILPMDALRKVQKSLSFQRDASSDEETNVPPQAGHKKSAPRSNVATAGGSEGALRSAPPTSTKPSATLRQFDVSGTAAVHEARVSVPTAPSGTAAGAAAAAGGSVGGGGSRRTFGTVGSTAHNKPPSSSPRGGNWADGDDASAIADPASPDAQKPNTAQEEAERSRARAAAIAAAAALIGTHRSKYVSSAMLHGITLHFYVVMLENLLAPTGDGPSKRNPNERTTTKYENDTAPSESLPRRMVLVALRDPPGSATASLQSFFARMDRIRRVERFRFARRDYEAVFHDCFVVTSNSSPLRDHMLVDPHHGPLLSVLLPELRSKKAVDAYGHVRYYLAAATWTHEPLVPVFELDGTLTEETTMIDVRLDTVSDPSLFGREGGSAGRSGSYSPFRGPSSSASPRGGRGAADGAAATFSFHPLLELSHATTQTTRYEAEQIIAKEVAIHEQELQKAVAQLTREKEEAVELLTTAHAAELVELNNENEKLKRELQWKLADAQDQLREARVREVAVEAELLDLKRQLDRAKKSALSHDVTNLLNTPTTLRVGAPNTSTTTSTSANLEPSSSAMAASSPLPRSSYPHNHGGSLSLQSPSQPTMVDWSSSSAGGAPLPAPSSSSNVTRAANPSPYYSTPHSGASAAAADPYAAAFQPQHPSLSVARGGGGRHAAMGGSGTFRVMHEEALESSHHPSAMSGSSSTLLMRPVAPGVAPRTSGSASASGDDVMARIQQRLRQGEAYLQKTRGSGVSSSNAALR